MFILVEVLKKDEFIFYQKIYTTNLAKNSVGVFLSLEGLKSEKRSNKNNTAPIETKQ